MFRSGSSKHVDGAEGRKCAATRAAKSLASAVGPLAEIVYWIPSTTVVDEMIAAVKRQPQQGDHLLLISHLE